MHFVGQLLFTLVLDLLPDLLKGPGRTRRLQVAVKIGHQIDGNEISDLPVFEKHSATGTGLDGWSQYYILIRQLNFLDKSRLLYKR